MNLVKDDKLVRVLPEIEIRLAQFREIGVRFEVEIDRLPLFRDGQCERRFPNLARSDERDGGIRIDEFC